ncbi:hypothetical protein POPTR_010G000901v4 [Populus trichocarpa]|uniref:Uncharacterized protein n=1 Tax=Populus trichocarpa TaxID=3694 RepID=A0ACC0SBG6_POPTR|nr:hypothetical protein BDE02_10G000800 [Populus trichocarpa]KAI9386260.1 hypothetical protein POPTR_010G000901v4 [Populus trichocarpa]
MMLSREIEYYLCGDWTLDTWHLIEVGEKALPSPLPSSLLNGEFQHGF